MTPAPSAARAPADPIDGSVAAGGEPIRRLIPLALLVAATLGILRFAAHESGLIGEELGAWLMLTLLVGLLLVLLLRVAAVLDHAQAERMRAERENQAAAPALAKRAKELERANEELADAKAQLERSNAELQRFATVASHDLREPLRVVSGFADLLARRYGDQVEGDGARFLEAITGGVKRMDDMISDLLAYARAGRADQPLERVDCNEVVAETIAALDHAIKDAGAVVEVDELPTVTGNPAALGQLFQNLIANAIKFVADEPPRIRVWAADIPGGWRFAVRDNGIGIPPDQAKKIFGMFTRGPHGGEYPGTGVGLAVCQRIVDVHGGRIWVEEAPGGGSQFMFTIGDSRAGEPR